MKCRIGITSNLEQRERAWRATHPNLNNWTILMGPLGRKEAQAWETKLAAEQGCQAHPGGDEPDNPNAKWYVYRFEY